MHKLLRAGILIAFGMLIICIISGCGDDLSEEVTDPSDPRTDDASPPHTGPPFTGVVFTFTLDPTPGGEIPSNTQFSLTFDGTVTAVTVNGVAATGSGFNWGRIAGATGRRRSNPEC